MSLNLAPLQHVFGERLLTGVPLAKYTAARIGGPAPAFLSVKSSNELARAAELCREFDLPFRVIGAGSNLLVADAGVKTVILLNRARHIRFSPAAEPPTVWAESGASTVVIAHQAAARGLSGFEWAAGIPGTLGGAVVGNAGAHGVDTAGILLVAEILQHDGQREFWSVERLEYAYRSSLIKRNPESGIVLSATLALHHRPVDEINADMNRFLEFRRRTQPPGASMGSMFKNPPADFAGRLIDASGLKGYRVGNAQISELHANFFINLGGANAEDVNNLIDFARRTVQDKFGVWLELEIEKIGEWKDDGQN